MKDNAKIIKTNVSPERALEYYTHQTAQHGKFLCPFHNDRHPSLSVKGEHWCCWSCGESGDVISFTQKYFNLGFVEAVSKLADDFGITIQRYEQRKEEKPLDMLWRLVGLEAKQRNRAELAEYKAQLLEQILELTAIHRSLAQQHADDGILDKYAGQIDELEAELSMF